MKKLMNYCKRCVYPEISVNLMMDDDGICSSCRVFEDSSGYNDTDWKKREKKFLEIMEKVSKNRQGDYDCIIPVGGGKDSYYQTYVMKEKYGFTPLLVTYHGNNYLPEGQGNLDRMRDVFGVDHIKFGPSTDTLIKLNRMCFKKMGDMNWHAHAGIKIYPLILAVKFKIPVMIWGEIFWDISGMFSPEDFVEYNKRTVLEHDLRGYTWKDMIGPEEGLTEKDLNWMKMPSDEEIEEAGVKGLFLGNFFDWDPTTQTQLMTDKYQFEMSRLPFERTYRRMSNLDDMHENGIHDYMKYIKFGYGRASDHASKDIRTGYMSRDEGIEMVRKYDHVKPMRDLSRWLEYVDMKEDEFDAIADTFRDSRVWTKSDKDEWEKDNIWDFEERTKTS